MPLEEILTPAAGAGSALLVARTWMLLHWRRRRKPGP
jgi:hypothetical protein